MKYQRIARRELQRPAIGHFRCTQVKVMGHLDPSHPRVGLREIRLERKRAGYGLA